MKGKYEGKYSCSNLEIFEDIKACDFQYGTELQYTIPWMKVGIQTDLTMFTRKGYNSNEAEQRRSSVFRKIKAPFQFLESRHNRHSAAARY